MTQTQFICCQKEYWGLTLSFVQLWSVKQINQREHTDFAIGLRLSKSTKREILDWRFCLFKRLSFLYKEQLWFLLHTTSVHVTSGYITLNLSLVQWSEAGRVCRFFRKSTVCFSWIKEDLWWPSDTHLCQLDIFGKALQGCASSFWNYTQSSKWGEGIFLLNSILFVVGLSVIQALFSPSGWVSMRAETGTNIASPYLHSMLMGCWGSLERTPS